MVSCEIKPKGRPFSAKFTGVSKLIVKYGQTYTYALRRHSPVLALSTLVHPGLNKICASRANDGPTQ